MYEEELGPASTNKLDGSALVKGKTMMSCGTRRRSGTALALWLLLALTLVSSWTAPARAQGTRPARESIVGSRLRDVVEMIPGSDTDLPPFLKTPKDVYLLVTAGAAYTEVEVLANPEVSPPLVAQALSLAITGTPLAGKTVRWSADSYSAAQVSEQHRRFGAMRGSNAVPIAPLMVGLRRAGLTPHLLLRIAGHGQAVSLPRSNYGTRTFRWYDAQRLGTRGSITVTAQTTWRTPVYLLTCFLLPSLVCLLGLGLAGVVSSRGQRDDMARRLLFRRISRFAFIGAFLAQLGGTQFLLLRTAVPAALADLWLGSSTTTVLVPFIVGSALILPLFLILARKLEIRRFGAVTAGPVSAIPMSDEEKAVRKRVAQYSMVPHLIGMALLFAALFTVPRTSPLYSFVHPIAMFLPIVGGGFVTWLFKKRLDKFTQKTLDDDLTWRARQLGQTLGARMPDVFVEDSSRAAHLASATHQGHHVTLSRKLQETFTAAEMDFVLAHHLACMKRRGGNGGWIGVLSLTALVPVFFAASFLLKFVPGAPSSTALILSPWFVAIPLGYLFLCLVLLSSVVARSTKRQAKQDADTDRDALEVTGNLAAAESALDKLSADAALSPEAQMAARLQGQIGGGLRGKSGKNIAQLEAGRLLLRRLALQKTAQTLRFAPAPGAKPEPADLSPFSSSSKAEQAE